MLSDNTPDAQIKLVDFGLAALVQANEPMRTICGTWAYYGTSFNVILPHLWTCTHLFFFFFSLSLSLSLSLST
jgi:hypothetical protein